MVKILINNRNLKSRTNETKNTVVQSTKIKNKSTSKKTHSSCDLSTVFSNIVNNSQVSFFKDYVSIFTPYSRTIPLDNINELKNTYVLKFLQEYLKDTKTKGLFEHQKKMFDYQEWWNKNFILTSSTGSGKSLCFWAWVIENLLEDTDSLEGDPESTAILCFPTQALMWSQISRIAKISDPDSLKISVNGESALSGTLSLNDEMISWTVWKGTTNDKEMKNHEESEEFNNARIRIATLDKAHWSLLTNKNSIFLDNLKCIVLDEVHQYDGIFGFNVKYFLIRLKFIKELKEQDNPLYFLTSATLSNPKKFASSLLSINENQLQHIANSKEPEVNKINFNAAKQILMNPRKDGNSRIVLFVDSTEHLDDIKNLLFNPKNLTGMCNIIYFSQSKRESRELKQMLLRETDRRPIYIYDANITSENRRSIENTLNSSKNESRGFTLLATNALELGVDIENLNICLINEIPPKLIDLLQRIGRVGRSHDKPGLVIINISSNPIGTYITKNLESAFLVNDKSILPIPDDITSIKLKHMYVLNFENGIPEWRDSLIREYEEHDRKKYVNKVEFEYKKFHQKMSRQNTDLESAFQKKMSRDYKAEVKNQIRTPFEKYFGFYMDVETIESELNDIHEGFSDLRNKFKKIHHAYSGFRGISNNERIPLVTKSNKNNVIEYINKVDIFRDAPPKAAYLDAQGNYWIIDEYTFNENHKDFDNIKEIIVHKYNKEKPKIYEYRTIRYFKKEFITSSFIGKRFLFGLWDCKKSLAGIKIPRGNFDNNVNLPDFHYKVFGWCCSFDERTDPPTHFSDQTKTKKEELISKILRNYFADELQVIPANIEVFYSDEFLGVFDATPDCIGLAELLLCHIQNALTTCVNDLDDYQKSGKKKYQKYIENLCHTTSIDAASGIIQDIKKIKSSL
jgi:ATP-dependent helicase YprA (DUF1998 family)